MFCPHCGKQIPDDSRFCHYCGMKVQVKAVAQEPPSPQPSPDTAENKSVEQPIHHGKYNLNPKTPSFSWRHLSTWDDTTANSITEYKHNMGFTSGKENIIGATLAITQSAGQPFLKQVKAEKDQKRKQSVYFGNLFDPNEYANIFVLSFEDDGLLMIGIKKTVTHHESRQGDYNTVDYALMRYNGFIPKRDISQAKLFKYTLYRTLVIHTKVGILSFIIKPTWNDKLYQIKNYRHLSELTNRLN